MVEQTKNSLDEMLLWDSLGMMATCGVPILRSLDTLKECFPAYATEIGEQIANAGSIFLGNYSPESVGDYASGTNHTLPTNGFARAYSGVSVDSFVKKITFQHLTKKGLTNIGHAVIEMATAEGLDAHANAVKVRLSS